MIKGFNKMVRTEKAPKRTRVLKEETKVRKLQEVLDQLEDGRVCTSIESQTWKTFDSSTDLFVERVLQAIKYGGSKEEIHMYGAKTFDLLKRKGIDLTLGKAMIYQFAKDKKGMGQMLNEIANVLDLEGPDVRVVASDDEEDTEEDASQVA